VGSPEAGQAGLQGFLHPLGRPPTWQMETSPVELWHPILLVAKGGGGGWFGMRRHVLHIAAYFACDAAVSAHVYQGDRTSMPQNCVVCATHAGDPDMLYVGSPFCAGFAPCRGAGI
jgi:hypothetical protein